MPILFLNGLLAKDVYATFELVTEPLNCAIWFLVLPAVLLERVKYVPRFSWVPRFVFLFAWASAVVQLRTKYLMSQAQPGLSYFFVLYCIGFAFLTLLVGVTYFVQPDHFKAIAELARTEQSSESPQSALAADNPILSSTRARSESQSELVPNPEEKAYGLSLWTFGWLTPLIRAGYRAPLQFSQMWLLSRRWRASNVASEFGKVWQEEQAAAAAAGRKASLVTAFRKGFGWYYAWAGVDLFIQNCFQCVMVSFS